MGACVARIQLPTCPRCAEVVPAIEAEVNLRDESRGTIRVPCPCYGGLVAYVFVNLIEVPADDQIFGS